MVADVHVQDGGVRRPARHSSPQAACRAVPMPVPQWVGSTARPVPCVADRNRNRSPAVLVQRSRRPSYLRGRLSGLSSRSSGGSRAPGVFWYATGRSQRSTAVPPTEVDVDVVAG